MVEAWNPHVRTSAIPKAVLHTYSLVHIRDDITAGYVYVCKIRSASHWAPDKGRKGGGTATWKIHSGILSDLRLTWQVRYISKYPG